MAHKGRHYRLAFRRDWYLSDVQANTWRFSLAEKYVMRWAGLIGVYSGAIELREVVCSLVDPLAPAVIAWKSEPIDWAGDKLWSRFDVGIEGTPQKNTTLCRIFTRDHGELVRVVPPRDPLLWAQAIGNFPGLEIQLETPPWLYYSGNPASTVVFALPYDRE